MNAIADVFGHYAHIDAKLAAEEELAFDRGDETAFDAAWERRRSNDQAYLLYLFTRFEEAVNEAVAQLLSHRIASTPPWPERRVWQAVRRGKVKDLGFMVRVELLIDKSRADYAFVDQLYDERNAIAHGGAWRQPYDLAAIATRMGTVIQSFVTS